MSKLKIVAILLGIAIGGTAIANTESIVDRIKKVGDVCVEGHECASETASASSTMASASSGGGDVESNYNKSCATCHNAGVAGAPKYGEAGAWDDRLAEKGIEALYLSGINGIPPAMPAKGMCFSCSDDDIKALVDYMIQASAQ